MSDNNTPPAQGLPRIPPHDDSLWEAMMDMLNGGKKQKVEKKLEKIKAKAEAPIKKPKHRWVEEEIVLIIHEASCKGCGAHFQWPNSHLLIRKSHATLGTHYVQAAVHTYCDPEVEYSALPFRREYQLTEVAVCQHCFDLSHLLVTAAITKSQTPTSSAPQNTGTAS